MSILSFRNKKSIITVIYATPNIREVFNFANRLIVLGSGKKITGRNTRDSSINEIVSFIVGSKWKE